jgi:N-methylhydantoinase A
MFGYRTDEPVELVALRCLARGRQAGTYAFQPSPRQNAKTGTPREMRRASFGAGQDFVSTPVYDWDAVGTSAISGPAIVESYDTTVVVPPGASISADPFGSLVIEIA